ncbi:uncharacterized protein LOC125373176 isoform X1 [Haliotis rufescens]|uniref:uncharacterized protein LOC125373176 isoform X1 n=1 Tax=Haliotis rufescens TaxID=6454 RepID=UPI00201FA670|nr:uncharacterized protein LOC125373176 isoform X1 [Haliotis rufescens]
MIRHGLLAVFTVHLTLLFPICQFASLPQTTNDIKEHYFGKRQTLGKYLIHSYYSPCERSANGLRKYRCPTLDQFGNIRCIDDNSLCNHVPDCPEGEDEQPSLCLFYKVIDRDLKALFDFIVERFETHLHRRH